ncbi:MAG: hypothetical protein CMN30_16015 [Sandaracinus sp.]|nr:hypothetical protein [Sandaracinus sp.]|tara:strand:+ start:239 stop:1201 length:963 start_codon:yes stop_codon:yes gene_type:complete
MRSMLLSVLALALASAGCEETALESRRRDGAASMETPDAAPMDDGAIGPVDGGSSDAGSPDAGSPDGGPPVGTTDCARVQVRVMPGLFLNVRPDATTSMEPIGRVFDGMVLEVSDVVSGETVGTSDRWYQVRVAAGEGYVHADYAECTTEPLSPPDLGYYLPFACGFSARVTQAPGGSLSHTGRTMYAYDFGVALNTPVHAMRAGLVTAIRADTRPGDDCYDGGGSTCGPYANWIILQHADGNTTAYKHLNAVDVAVGQAVARGQLIGHSGSTGYSTGPHLHQELRGDCPTEIYCQTIQLTFSEVGRPTAGDTVTSGNCP